MHYRDTIEEDSVEGAFMVPGDFFLAAAIKAGIEKSPRPNLPGGVFFIFF